MPNTILDNFKRKLVQYGDFKTVSRNTLTNYLSYLHDTCLIFSIENYAYKFAERATTMKHYFADNGQLNIFLRTSDTLLLENIVATTLRRKHGEGNFFPLLQYRNRFNHSVYKTGNSGIMEHRLDQNPFKRNIHAGKITLTLQ